MKTFVIGRDAGNQIVLNDKLVSRYHAQLTVLDNGQVMIKDLGSSNGTFVNGNRITETFLNTGDIVKCGPVFLNWIQYVNSGASFGQQGNYQQPVSEQNYANVAESNLPEVQYGLSDVFKYLSYRIFEIGDLFKTNWDRTSSIVILKCIPVLITLLASVIAYSRLELPSFYFSPTVLAMFVFAVSPFITIYLLSLNKRVTVDKIALSSGIIGFIQFVSLLCYVVYIWLYSRHITSGYGGYFSNQFENRSGFDLFVIITALLVIILLVNLAIAFYVFIYKYFVSIGINRSKAIYLVIITICLNLFFQILSAYIIYLIVKDNITNYLF